MFILLNPPEPVLLLKLLNSELSLELLLLNSLELALLKHFGKVPVSVY